MADVFLSYSSQDRAMAAHVQAALEAAGVSVFWDQETPVGQDWNTWIGQKLADSKVCVVLWSAVSVASRNVVHEATIAAERGALIPAVIAPLKPEQFPMGFYTVQAADLTSFRGQAGHEGMARLIAAVHERLGRPAAEAQPGTAKAKSGPPALLVGFAIGGVALIGAAYGVIQMQPRQADSQSQQPELPATTTLEAPPTPASGISVGAELEFLMALEGRWNWQGLACDKGPKVTLDNGDLIFTTPDTRFVHEVGEVTREGVVNTIVKEPAAFEGDVYTLSRSGDALTVTLLKTPPEVNVWTRCGD